MELRNTPLFSGVFEDDSATVIRYSYKKRYRKNAIVITQGDKSDSFYFVLSGRLRSYIDDEQGREMTLGILEAGAFFGEIGSLGGTRRPSNVVALEDSQVSIVSRHNLERCIAKYPEVGTRIINHLVRRIESLIEEVGALVFKDVNARVARLLNQAAQSDGTRRITPPMTQQDIANAVGSSREMISRCLKSLKDAGYLSAEGKRLVIDRDLPGHL